MDYPKSLSDLWNEFDWASMGEVLSKRGFYPICRIKTGKKRTGSVSQRDGLKMYFPHHLLAVERII